MPIAGYELEHIGKALEELLASEVFATGMLGWRAVELWDRVVGESIARRSRAVRFDRGRLYVEVESSTWIQELSFLRHDIRRRLNDDLGREVVTGIHFSLEGGGPRKR